MSAYFDIPHGLGLGVIHPHYLRYIYKNHLKKFKRFALEVFSVNPVTKSDDDIALKGIERLQEFFYDIGGYPNLRAFNIPEESLEEIAKNTKIKETS